MLPLTSIAIHSGAFDLKIISISDIGNSPSTNIAKLFLLLFQVEFGFEFNLPIIISSIFLKLLDSISISFILFIEFEFSRLIFFSTSLVSEISIFFLFYLKILFHR